MKLEIDIPKHQYNNIMALDSINLGRAPYKGIIMYAINAIKRGKALEQEPRKGHWIGQKKIGFGEWKECIVPLKDGFVTDSCSCSECGDWLTGSDE